MRKLLPVILLLSLCLDSVAATGKCDARILESEESFEMSSPSSGRYTVKKKIEVLNSNGDDAAMIVIYNDDFTTLTSFSGQLESGGRKTKLSMKDLSFTEYSQNLADNSRYYYYKVSAQYPYVIEYEYVLSEKKGVATFPSFRPLTTPDTSLETDATYSVVVPEGCKVAFKSSSQPTLDHPSSKVDRYVWTFPKNSGITEEEYMPDLREYGDYVYACPVDFVYGGLQGSQRNWKEFGSWLCKLQEGCDELPEAFKSKVQDMTKDCVTDYQKVRRLYVYLADNTRYVSIQLGIGGLKSIPASRTLMTGYGDCKSLSFFLKAMLKAAGIKSECVVLNTEEKDFLEGFPSISQFDHMMLCVPVASDTLWVECTDPLLPLGYRHEKIAGHQVLLLTEEGGKLLRVPEYDSALRKEVSVYNVDLSDDGSAVLKENSHNYLDFSEPCIAFRSLSPEEQESAMTQSFKFRHTGFKLVSVTDNFKETDKEEPLPDFCPEVTLDIELKAMNYARSSGDRIFVPLNPMFREIDFEKTERVNPIHREWAETYVDSISLSIPEAYQIESLPPDADIRSDFGTFSSTVSKTGKVLTIVQTIQTVKGDFPASAYADFRQFAESVTKLYGAKLVLKKKTV